MTNLRAIISCYGVVEVAFFIESDALENVYKLRKEYPNAKIYLYRADSRWLYLNIEFENEADEAEFILKESI